MKVRAETFHPLSIAEVGTILDDLAAEVDRNPAIVLNPAFMGMARLAITASGHAKSAPPPSWTVERTPTTLECTPTVHVAPPPSTDHEARIAELEARLAQSEKGRGELAASLSAAESSAQSLGNEIHALKERHAEYVEEHRQRLVDAAIQVHDEKASLFNQIAALTQQVTMQKTATADALRLAEETQVKSRTVAKEAVVRILRLLEWSGKSRFMIAATNRPRKACPSCLGTDPTGLRPGKEVGHTKDCLIAKLIAEAEAGR